MGRAGTNNRKLQITLTINYSKTIKTKDIIYLNPNNMKQNNLTRKNYESLNELANHSIELDLLDACQCDFCRARRKEEMKIKKSR